jgi:hypothetical protein
MESNEKGGAISCQMAIDNVNPKTHFGTKKMLSSLHFSLPKYLASIEKLVLEEKFWGENGLINGPY